MGFWTIVTVPIFVVVFAVSYQSIKEHQIMKPYHTHETGVILITGTSHGIGHHALFALAKQGYHVFGTVRNKQSLEELSKEAKSQQLESNVHPIIMDILNTSHIDQTLLTITEFTNKTQLPLVGIINNAGVMYLSPFETTKEDKVREIVGTNCIGPLVLTQTFIPIARQYKSRILFVTGFNGIATRYGQSIYSGSKHGLEAAIESIRQEMYRFGVSVSAILPGCITTSPKKKNNPLEMVELPKEYNQLYGENMKHLLKITKQGLERCSSPSVVSDAMLLALREPYPQTRYYVGDVGNIVPFWMWNIIRMVTTDRLYDKIRVWESNFLF